jgi:hypothetical protein
MFCRRYVYGWVIQHSFFECHESVPDVRVHANQQLDTLATWLLSQANS